MALPILGQTDFSPLFRAQENSLQSQQYASQGFVNLGKQISASIQLNNAKREAQEAAPLLAASYQNGMQAIMNNQIPEGISTIFAANAQFANNPILAPSLEMLTRTAGSLANQVMSDSRYRSAQGTRMDGFNQRQMAEIQAENARRQAYNANRPSDQPPLPEIEMPMGSQPPGIGVSGAQGGPDSFMGDQSVTTELPSYDQDTIPLPQEADMQNADPNQIIPSETQQSAPIQVSSPAFQNLSPNQKVQAVRQQFPFTPLQEKMRAANVGPNDFVINDAGPGYAATGAMLIVDVPEKQAMQRAGMTVDPINGKISVSYKDGKEENIDNPRIREYQQSITMFSQSPQLINAVSRMGGLANNDVEFTAVGKDANDQPQYTVSVKSTGAPASKSERVTVRDSFGLEQPLTVSEDVKKGYMQAKPIISEFETGIPIKGGGKLRAVKIDEKTPYDNTAGKLPMDAPLQDLQAFVSATVPDFQNLSPETQYSTAETIRLNWWEAFDDVVRKQQVDQPKMSQIMGDPGKFDQFREDVRLALGNINKSDPELKKVIGEEISNDTFKGGESIETIMASETLSPETKSRIEKSTSRRVSAREEARKVEQQTQQDLQKVYAQENTLLNLRKKGDISEEDYSTGMDELRSQRRRLIAKETQPPPPLMGGF